MTNRMMTLTSPPLVIGPDTNSSQDEILWDHYDDDDDDDEHDKDDEHDEDDGIDKPFPSTRTR